MLTKTGRLATTAMFAGIVVTGGCSSNSNTSEPLALQEESWSRGQRDRAEVPESIGWSGQPRGLGAPAGVDENAEAERVRGLEKQYRNGHVMAAYQMADVLPLPGQYGGLVISLQEETTEMARVRAGRGPGEIPPAVRLPVEMVHGIALSPQDMSGMRVRSGMGEHQASKSSPDDVYIWPVSERSSLLFVGSNGQLPIEITVAIASTGSQSVTQKLNLKDAIKSGRGVVMHAGTFRIDVADPGTKRVTKILRYDVAETASAGWDDANDAPLWEGLRLSVDPPGNGGSR